MSREREFQFTRKDFEWIREKVTGETGIQLNPSKDQMVYSRLARRLRALGLPDFASYRKVLEQDNGEEMGQFVNALTTNLTAFFRESHHFDHLAEILPELAGGPINIWSAGCSTGEEAYSIAMTVLENLSEQDAERVTITATDLDSSVVEHGRRGIYDEGRLSGVPALQKKRYFLRGTGRNAGKAKVKEPLRRMVTFDTQNLLHDWPFSERFQIVFCRNTVIYFNKELQAHLFERLHRYTAPGAWLYIGHSESLWKVTERFVSHGRTIYERVD
ncbi:CheR family methyltransferase [Vreelandella utahensis]|uniref:CheR family methyltransferase n=1 Tax=Vreelandella halophila TaxID=86177 RepID=UPI000987B83B|nr:protein-glutamate O-methyltransferase CheR [Halomonas utahensis]